MDPPGGKILPLHTNLLQGITGKRPPPTTTGRKTASLEEREEVRLSNTPYQRVGKGG